jgi:hypothetical protein
MRRNTLAMFAANANRPLAAVICAQLSTSALFGEVTTGPYLSELNQNDGPERTWPRYFF